MNDNAIVFKGTKDGLYIMLKEEADFDTIKAQLEEKIKPSRRFFEGAKIVNFKGKRISETEYFELKDIVENQYGMEVTGDYNTLLANNIFEDADEKIKKYCSVVEPKYGEEEEGLFIQGTIRSGQLIKYDGNITVIGDVNPGAHLKASGSIIVMGIMRGIGHAGCTGNYNTYIAAFRLEPMQLRIGDIITRSPDGKQYKPKVPEMAVVRRGMIVVEPYLSKK